MEQNLNNKIEIKTRLISFYKENKIKILIFFILILVLVVVTSFLKINNEKKNNIISEKYIEAGILFTKNEKDKSKKIYEDILKSNNRFYSSLALNIILEKNLEKNKEKILEYFDKVENLQNNKEQKDILKLKKALFFLKNSENEKAKILLNELIKSESKIKDLAEKILVYR